MWSPASVCFAATPASRELSFVDFAATGARPGLDRARLRSEVSDQRFGSARLMIAQNPQLGEALEERDLAEASGQLLVLDHAGDSGLLEQVLQVTEVREGLAEINSLHRAIWDLSLLS
jgi:hypothetical protein